MRSVSESPGFDRALLSQFEREVWSRVPHLEGGRVANATPLVDLTGMLRDCAREEYSLDLSDRDFRVFGKLEAGIASGSVKVRPAVQIIHEAIRSGKLRRGQTIFEATSGNFGIALGLMAGLGVDVVTLVSRRLQEGVFEELRRAGVKTVDLDMDICPAPGVKVDMNTLTAKALFTNIRSQLGQHGLDPKALDESRSRVEGLLAAEDVINLAKFLAEIYGGFCPEQYDNELNVAVHETVTAAEIDQQLLSLGSSLGDFEAVCTFGTGGTSGGLSRYVQKKYGKKNVRVVFPLSNQEVAGIRTKEKASGLKFYEPDRYAGQHEVNFGEARRLLGFFVARGKDIGESSALALYSVLEMVNFGLARDFVVILPDGAQKYTKNLGIGEQSGRREVTLEEVIPNIGSYSSVLWTHAMFTPKEEGIELIARSLGVDKTKIKVARASDVNRFIASGEMPMGMSRLLNDGGKRPLLVCMAGSTSLRVAQLLAEGRTEAVSLVGGIAKLSEIAGTPLPSLVRISME